jgi:hypothetical protein
MTEKDFTKTLQAVVNQCAEKECRHYATAFLSKARMAKESGDNQSQELFSLLAAICSFDLANDNDVEPLANGHAL